MPIARSAKRTPIALLGLLLLALLWSAPRGEASDAPSLKLSEGWLFRPATETDDLLIADAVADLAIAGGGAVGWSPVKVPGDWFQQGFNPSRAGWYRCEVKLPGGRARSPLALEVAARCVGEIVYVNGVPVGARRKAKAGIPDKSVYLIPGPLTAKGACTVAIRLDAPGVRRPGLAAVPVLRPATVEEYMTPPRNKDGRLLHRPEGLDFFPRDPIRIGDLLVNVCSERYGCAYVLGDDELRMKVVVARVTPPGGRNDEDLGVVYTITDEFTNAEVQAGVFTIETPADRIEKPIELYAGRPGAFRVRFLFSSGETRRALGLRYSVFPKPPTKLPADSPFGLILSAHPAIARLSGAHWITHPGVLTTSFTWDSMKTPSHAVLLRMAANAQEGGYRVVSEFAEPPHVRLIVPPQPDDPHALVRAKESYLKAKASGRGILQMTIPADRLEAFDPLLAQGVANYCDVLCLGYKAPAGFEPEVLVPAKVRELRSIAAGCTVPPAPAITLSASEHVAPAKVVRACLTAVAAGAWRVFWDATGEAGWVRPDGSPEPRMVAFACMTRVLGQAKYLGRLDAGPAVHALAFHTGAENVLAVWKTGAPGTVALPAARRVVGMMAEPIAAAGEDATEVMISETPVYLCGVADADLKEVVPPDWPPTTAAVIGRLEVMGRADAARVVIARAPVGELGYGENDLAVELENWSPRTISGTAELQLPQGWAADPAGQPFALPSPGKKPGRTVLRFSVRIPLTSPPGEYAVPVTVTTAEKKSALAPLRLSLTTPVGDLANIHLAEDYSSAPSMAVPVRNPFADRIEARVGLTINDWTVTPSYLPVSLAPGEEKLLRFLVSGRLPVVGPLEVDVEILQKDNALTVKRTANISKQRVHGWAIGEPEVQTLRFDGRKLSYKLSKMAVVSIRIYDSQGILVLILDSGWQSAGPHDYTWRPEREFDESGGRISYRAEVRAGLDVLFDRQIAASQGVVFGPRSVSLDAKGNLYVFEELRAMKFAPSGKYRGCDLPGAQHIGLTGIKPLAPGKYVVLLKDQLLLVDSSGNLLKALPADPREGGDIGPGYFRKPASQAVSPNGLIYVADRGNHRVQRFDSDLEPSRLPRREGNFIGKLDAYRCPVAGTGDGEFTSPAHIAVNSRGRLAVFDATGRLQFFDAAGNHLKTFVTPLKRIACMGIDSDAVFIARPGEGTITKYNTGGDTLKAAKDFGEEGSAAVESGEILAIEADGHGKLFVCGNDPGAVFIMSASSGEPLGTLGSRPPGDAIEAPAGIDVDEQGGVVVTDLAARRVVRLSAGGGNLWSAPGPHTPLVLHSPIDVALGPLGNVYVLDHAAPAKRIVMLSPRGHPRFGFNGSYVLESEQLEQATALEVTAGGNLWAGKGQRGMLLDRSGNVLARYALRPHTKAEAGGVVYVPWREGSARGLILRDVKGQEIARKGGLGADNGKFAGCMPGGIAARVSGPGKPDYVYYADTFNHRITVLRVEWNSISQATGNW